MPNGPSPRIVNIWRDDLSSISPERGLSCFSSMYQVDDPSTPKERRQWLTLSRRLLCAARTAFGQRLRHASDTTQWILVFALTRGDDPFGVMFPPIADDCLGCSSVRWTIKTWFNISESKWCLGAALASKSSSQITSLPNYSKETGQPWKYFKQINALSRYLDGMDSHHFL